MSLVKFADDTKLGEVVGGEVEERVNTTLYTQGQGCHLEDVGRLVEWG